MERLGVLGVGSARRATVGTDDIPFRATAGVLLSVSCGPNRQLTLQGPEALLLDV